MIRCSQVCFLLLVILVATNAYGGLDKGHLKDAYRPSTTSRDIPDVSITEKNAQTAGNEKESSSDGSNDVGYGDVPRELIQRAKLARPKRGHHVINNGVLKIFKQIIDLFIMKSGLLTFCELAPRLTGTAVLDAYRSPMSEADADAIRYTMVYNEELEGEDTNGNVYGRSVYELYNLVTNYMLSLRNDNPDDDILGGISNLINQMNINKVYVDQRALRMWAGTCRNRQRLFQSSKNSVVNMLSRLTDKQQLQQWTNELVQADANARVNAPAQSLKRWFNTN